VFQQLWWRVCGLCVLSSAAPYVHLSWARAGLPVLPMPTGATPLASHSWAAGLGRPSPCHIAGGTSASWESQPPMFQQLWWRGCRWWCRAPALAPSALAGGGVCMLFDNTFEPVILLTIHSVLCCAVLCCAVLCCAVLCCVVLLWPVSAPER
jgi:hypothetical protein